MSIVCHRLRSSVQLTTVEVQGVNAMMSSLRSVRWSCLLTLVILGIVILTVTRPLVAVAEPCPNGACEVAK